MKVWSRTRARSPPALFRRAPFLLLKKFTPSCLLPEDRDDDTVPIRSTGHRPRVPLYNGINRIPYFAERPRYA